MASSKRVPQVGMLKKESCAGAKRISEQVIVENQRGITLFGYPFFSSKLLIPKVDPPQFHTEKDRQPISTATSNYYGNTNNKLLLPLNFKCSMGLTEEVGEGSAQVECVGERDDEFAWFVSMDYHGNYDIDDQGWCYSWSFRSKYWKGKNGFVRKRFWVRLPTRNGQLGYCAHYLLERGKKRSIRGQSMRRGEGVCEHEDGSEYYYDEETGDDRSATKPDTVPHTQLPQKQPPQIGCSQQINESRLTEYLYDYYSDQDMDERQRQGSESSYSTELYNQMEFYSLYQLCGDFGVTEQLQQLVLQLKKLPLDRQKFELLDEFVQNKLSPLGLQDLRRIVSDPKLGFAELVLQTFQFDVSRRKFLDKWVSSLLQDTRQQLSLR
ncbi:HDL100Wp [Eremothecium sinecaudum]|uniref:HDL100Wp n=1 Tax=Eremothecium sinecaudum TaxID=45286 RepID=A0A0X8HSI3_9SACH|nr:HDL100Wp [Eremothecium sinecaudum]AMD20644.1 HDL100Wp [Eremothecium sinecaudum]